MASGIVVLHPAGLPAAGAGEVDVWIYADEDAECYAAAEQAFAPTPAALPPRQFQAEAAALRQEFMAWTDANLRGAAVGEWLSTPLHRCTFPSPAPPIFLHVVWLVVIDRLLADGRGGRLAVITAHRGLAVAVAAVARRHGVSCREDGALRRRLDGARMRLRALAALAKTFLELAVRVPMARRLLGHRQLERLRPARILIDTYLHRADLSAAGDFCDRYFPGLVQWYRQQGIEAAVYPFLFRIGLREVPALYRAMDRSAVPMAPLELFVTLRDLLAALAASLRIALTRSYAGVKPFRGIAMFPMLPVPGFITALSAFVPFVLLRVPGGMARHGIRPALVLDWHEDQPIDKATVYGFTAAGAEVIGMRQYVPVPNYLSEYSTPEELAAGVAPRQQWVCGRILPDLLDVVASGVRYRVVPALRFAHVHDGAPGDGGDDLLVLLTHSLSESVQILALVLDHAKMPGAFARIVVKPQPNVPKTAAAIRRIAERRWPAAMGAGVVWSEEPMASVLATAKLVVSSGTSATLEAVCRGIPVVIVGNRVGLDAVPLAQVDQRIWRLAYDREEYCAAVADLSDPATLPMDVRVEIAKKTRTDYFCPTNEETMKAFVPSAPASVGNV